MKTFLWTTLFWIVAIIAFLIVSGFGNIVNPVFDQSYLVKVLPQSVITRIEDNAITNFKSSPDLCSEAEVVCIFDTTNETNLVDQISDNSEQMATLISGDIDAILNGQSILSQQISEQFAQLSQQINAINLVYPTSDATITQPEIDPMEQRRIELQSQIEALQSEMQNL